MKGATAVIETLLKQGSDTIFGIPGGTVIPLFDAFLEYEDKLRIVLVRHEQGAAHAADAYARVTGNAGVCIATSGPGVTNLVTGLMNAYMDSSPVIAIGGQVSVPLIGSDAFQESDMIGITLAITKHNYLIRDPRKISETILKAYKIATTGRPGPVYIDIPNNIQKEESPDKIPDNVEIPSYRPTLKGNLRQIKKAAELILNAERPLILAGGGVRISGASKELQELADLIKAPVTTTLMAKGSFPETHPMSLGMLGMHGRKAANYAVVNSDLIIAIGCRFSDRITGNLESFAENARVIHIDIDPAEIDKNVKVNLPIVGDCKMVLADLNTAIKKLSAKDDDTEWSKRMKELNELCECASDTDTVPISPIRVMKEIQKIKKSSDIVVTGVGQHQMFAAHFLKFDEPRHFISSGGAGTMGFCLPAAMGAKMASPGSNVFGIDGDGSFQMNIQELGTCKEENIKVIPIIMNNHYLGMVRQWLEIFFDRRYSSVALGNTPDFTKIAEAYSLEGINVTRPSEIGDALKQAVANPETTVVNIEIENESNILPMLPPGGHIKEAFGDCMSPGKFFEGY